MTTRHGQFTWHELMTPDKARAQSFYPEVFGWTVEVMDMASGPYSMLKAGDNAIGGFMTPPQAGILPHWVAYLSVANVDQTTKKIVAAGGKTLADAFDVPTVGRIQPVADPQGGSFCLFQAAESDPEPAEGLGSVHWNELWAQDSKAAMEFYSDVFGYTHSSMEMPGGGTYYVLEQDGVPRGGIMAGPAKGAPPMWLQYVIVDDADAAAERAKNGGAEIQGELMNAPNVGRFGVFKDPQGAVIGFIKPASPA